MATRISPLKSSLQKQAALQEKAMANLTAQREAFSKKFGHWPSDKELDKYLGKK